MKEFICYLFSVLKKKKPNMLNDGCIVANIHICQIQSCYLKKCSNLGLQ